jgi:hypothetical protein
MRDTSCKSQTNRAKAQPIIFIDVPMVQSSQSAWSERTVRPASHCTPSIDHRHDAQYIESMQQPEQLFPIRKDNDRCEHRQKGMPTVQGTDLNTGAEVGRTRERIEFAQVAADRTSSIREAPDVTRETERRARRITVVTCIAKSALGCCSQVSSVLSSRTEGTRARTRHVGVLANGFGSVGVSI